MNDIIEEIEKALKIELYFSALYLTMAIPDICAAVEAENYQTNSDMYKNWFNKYMAPLNPKKYGIAGNLKAKDMYIFRCKLFHQGASSEKKLTGYERLLFIEPNSEKLNIEALHCMVVGDKLTERSLLISVEKFCKDIITAFRDWEKINKSTKSYNLNFPRLIKRYPNGIAPVFADSVIG